MNLRLVRLLVLKDLFLHRLPLLGLSIGIPLFALGVATFGSDRWGFMGLVLMTNALIWLTFYLPLGTVLTERKQKTLAFVMSLPITGTDYAVAKLVTGLLAYLLPWTLFLLSLPWLTARSEQVPAGALPLMVAILTLFLLAYVLASLSAILVESLWLTSGVTTLLVVLAFAFVPSLASLPPRLLENWAGAHVVWDPEVVWTIFGLGLTTVIATGAGLALTRYKRELL